VAPLTVETSVQDGLATVTLAGELDLSTTDSLHHAVERVRAQPAPPVVALDLRELVFMDSSGLRAIAETDAKARAEGWRLVLVRGRPAVHRVFEITRLEERLHFVDEPGQAPSA